MNKYKDGIVYIFLGIIFFLITLDVIFPFVMLIMKLIFYCLSGLLVIGGFMQINDSRKKKQK